MIETGRRHQIRMAMKSIGHPIVGDLTHGATINPLARICLHATSLEFLHPKDDQPVRFEAKTSIQAIVKLTTNSNRGLIELMTSNL